VRIFDKDCLREVIDVIRKNIITLNILEGMIKNNEKRKSRAYIEDFIGISMHVLILLIRD
jgi:hypothetical protein